MIINITQAIYHLFENNQTFRDNWSSIDGDVETSMGNYIKNSISKIYNRQRPRVVQLLTTPDPSAIQMEVDFEPIGENEVWTKTDDFDSEMTVGQNDEMILVITMTERAGVRVHPRVKIYKHQI